MTITVRDPDGQTHEFADGTPDSAINAEMQRRWAARGTIPPAKPEPLAGPGQMPPGVSPSRMQAQPHAPDAHMVPLSEEAQQAQSLMRWKTLTGEKGGVQGAMDLLKTDPTYQAREKQAHKMGEDAGTLAAKQGAATRVYEAMNELEQKARAWLEHAPSAFNAATGEYYSMPSVQFATGWMNTGGQAFHRMMEHDISKLTALYREMPSTGKGGGSDAQDANFKNAMGEFMKAKTPEQFFAILQSAKGLIRAKGGLSHDFDMPYKPMHPSDVLAVNQYAARPVTENSPYVTGRIDVEGMLGDARDAIKRGASPVNVKARLKAMGIDPGNL